MMQMFDHYGLLESILFKVRHRDRLDVLLQ